MRHVTWTFFGLLGFGGFAAESAKAQTWENCTPIWSAIGESAGDQFGWIASNIGDIDGDSRNDVLVGVPSQASGGVLAGKIYVHSGASGALIRTAVGTTNERFGYMAVGLGDIDGDGVADYAVGAPDTLNTSEGRVYVYSGIDGNLIRTHVGEAIGDQFGKSLGAAGDVDGDGIGDLIVGAPQVDVPAGNTGKAYVYSGDDGLLIWEWSGDGGTHFLGAGVDGIGDRDGDGFGDVLIGASGAGGGGGLAYVYSGQTGLRECTLDPGLPKTNFGLYFLGKAGDVDADGTEDFYVSDFNNSGGAGRAWVYSGADCSTIHQLNGTNGSGFGIGRARAGDVDGDGFDDLLFGSWTFSAGAPAGGRAGLYSGLDGSLLFRFTGDLAGDNLGFDAAALGDVDGDGVGDYLLTAANFGGGRGATYVLSGAEPPRNFCVATPHSGGSAARITYTSSLSIADASFRLRALALPASAPGQFFRGLGTTNLPFGGGTLCVAPPLARLGTPVQANGNGIAFLDVDFTAPAVATGPAAIQPGVTWHFQYWFRDPGAPNGMDVNLTNGLSASFCP